MAAISTTGRCNRTQAAIRRPAGRCPWKHERRARRPARPPPSVSPDSRISSSSTCRSTGPSGRKTCLSSAANTASRGRRDGSADPLSRGEMSLGLDQGFPAVRQQRNWRSLRLGCRRDRRRRVPRFRECGARRSEPRKIRERVCAPLAAETWVTRLACTWRPRRSPRRRSRGLRSGSRARQGARRRRPDTRPNTKAGLGTGPRVPARGWLLHAYRSSLAVDGEVAASSRPRQRRGACWAGTGDAIGKRLRAAPSASTPHPSSCQSETPGRSATTAGGRRRAASRDWRDPGLSRFRARYPSRTRSRAPNGSPALAPRTRARPKAGTLGPTVTTTSAPTASRDALMAKTEASFGRRTTSASFLIRLGRVLGEQ
jgi:hypothetical protein